MKSYKHAPLKWPAIILVDNDDGAKKVFVEAGKLAGCTISFSSSELFYWLGQNLYLVKVPEPGGNGQSRIEDLFQPSLLQTTLHGKTFDLDKEHEAAGKYGKFKFAEEVVKPNVASIDFSGFVPLLDRIVAVLADYKKRQAKPTSAAAQ